MGLVNGEGFAVDAIGMEADGRSYHGKVPDEIDWTACRRPQYVRPPAPPHLPPNAPPFPSRSDGTMAARHGGGLRELRARGVPYTHPNFS